MTYRTVFIKGELPSLGPQVTPPFPPFSIRAWYASRPVYCALAWRDLQDGQLKPEAASVVPWFRQAYRGLNQSVCQGRWLEIRHGGRVCFAQWMDVGPFRTDHWQYVFGNERPSPNANQSAGLDVSPAVRDCLGLSGLDVTTWRFVDAAAVPPGPWRQFGPAATFARR